MSKVIVEKNKTTFDPIQLDIQITISSMEDYLAFKKDIKNINEDWEFESILVEDVISQLTEI